MPGYPATADSHERMSRVVRRLVHTFFLSDGKLPGRSRATKLRKLEGLTICTSPDGRLHFHAHRDAQTDIEL